MIIDYGNSPNATPEQLIQLLRDSVQLAFNEQLEHSDSLYSSLLKALGVSETSLRSDITSVSERLEEEAKALTDAISDLLERLKAVEIAAGGIDPIVEELAAMKGRLDAAEGNITNLTAKYNALEKRVEKLEK